MKIERIFVHELFHAIVSDFYPDGTTHENNTRAQEDVAIGFTNHFMARHFGEELRGRHNDGSAMVTPPQNPTPDDYKSGPFSANTIVDKSVYALANLEFKSLESVFIQVSADASPPPAPQGGGKQIESAVLKYSDPTSNTAHEQKFSFLPSTTITFDTYFDSIIHTWVGDTKTKPNDDLDFSIEASPETIDHFIRMSALSETDEDFIIAQVDSFENQPAWQEQYHPDDLGFNGIVVETRLNSGSTITLPREIAGNTAPGEAAVEQWLVIGSNGVDHISFEFADLGLSIVHVVGGPGNDTIDFNSGGNAQILMLYDGFSEATLVLDGNVLTASNTPGFLQGAGNGFGDPDGIFFSKHVNASNGQSELRIHNDGADVATILNYADGGAGLSFATSWSNWPLGVPTSGLDNIGWSAHGTDYTGANPNAGESAPLNGETEISAFVSQPVQSPTDLPLQTVIQVSRSTQNGHALDVMQQKGNAFADQLAEMEVPLFNLAEIGNTDFFSDFFSDQNTDYDEEGEDESGIVALPENALNGLLNLFDDGTYKGMAGFAVPFAASNAFSELADHFEYAFENEIPGDWMALG